MLNWLAALAQQAPTGGNWLVVLAAAITAIGATGGGVYAARSARKATEKTTQLSTYKDQVEGWRKDTETLRTQRREDEERHRAEREEDRQRFQTEVARCHQRIDDLAEAAARERRAFAAWARQVVILMRAHGVEFPAPPPGILDTDPGIPPVTGG